MASNVKVSFTNSKQILPNLWLTPTMSKRFYQVILLLSDGLMLLFAFALAYWVRFHLPISLFQEVEPSPKQYARLMIILMPVWLALFTLLRLYNFKHLLGGTSEYTRALNGCTSGMMLVVLVSFVDPHFVIARGWLVLSWALSSFFICMNRWFLRRAAQTLRHKGWFITPAIIIGTNPEAVSLATQLCDSAYSGLAILGFIATENHHDKSNHQGMLALPILGTLDRLPEIVKRFQVEQVVIATTAMTREQLLGTTLQLSNMPNLTMTLSSGLYEIFTTGMEVRTHNAVPLMTLNRLRLDNIEIMLKAVLDYSVVLLASLTLLPVLGILALLIKLDSPGPIFYRRRVLGVGGKEFDAFKFRTMTINGDEILAQHPELLAELNATHKLKNDPRITKVGRWLRQTSLDELPQFLNILFGQMSLVGPRMISPAEAVLYGDMKHNLLTVKPGLTGLWQVSGRSDLSYESRVQLDMHYIRNYSIWLDLQILFFQTIPAVLRGRGAY